MSAVKNRFNVTAARKYETKDGEKTHWVNVGRAVQWDDGNISIELHAVPVGNWFDGKLMLFPQDDNKQQGQRQDRQRPARGQQREQSYGDAGTGGFDDDSIPFAPFRRHAYY
jgi:hypothetical protein